MKAWFGGEILGSLSRTCREKRKEELRLHMAQVHAALSVAQLAAAVAGIVSDGSPHHLLSSKHRLPLSGGSPSDGKMNAAVASAAAFVAAVCAEAAESAGASRAHIASAISSGLAMQTPADMLTLTATAATCLRGAATLKLRASSPASWHVQEEGREMLAKGAELPIRTPPDRIIKAEVETKEGIFRNDLYGFCLLVLGTTGGTIEVLFDDDRQSKIWKSTISHLLCDQEMLSP
ncbi:hypothetical protein Taro_020759 [Colocasia esculenta]|uniref:VAN3-binding protein-like auxin canalisation domain-containing protein n=1 Tax=Colocasia esculenta TaxID=4460 RepID=A0A843V665_COLES|nr:hypothetical protein [Colocasia esculenta]